MYHDPIPRPDAVPAPADQRRGKRHASVLLIGRVRHAAGYSACLVHDISARGLMARFTQAPAVGERLWIEVRGLPEVAATVRWVECYKGGVEFDTAQDIAGVFCLRDDQGHVARTPRFDMAVSASLRIGDRRVAVDILDISPGGVKLSSAIPLHTGQAGSILLPGINAITFGAICWTREDRAGFRFCSPLPLASLSQVLGCG
ncbi:MAG: PilZ domain-containing protein [Sphingomonas taxi]